MTLCIGGDFNAITAMLQSGEALPHQVRFFVGYAGWDKEQLAKEIEDNSWIIAPITDTEVMSDAEDLWEHALKKLGKMFEYMSEFPEDPNLN